MRPQAMAPTESEAFLWQVPGVAVSAALTRGVLGGIRAGLEVGESAAPEEFGGILLGSFECADGEECLTRVVGFEPFSIEHRYGPSFSLSLRDEKRLRQRLEKLERGHNRPVGFFRSHLRRGLYLDQRDFDLFQSEFPHPASIFLLVRPDAEDDPRGAVFVREGQDMRRHASYLEFPIEEDPAAAAVPPAAPVAAPVADAARPIVNQLPGLGWSLPRIDWRLPSLNVEPAKLRSAVLVLMALGLPLAAFYVGRDVGLRKHREEDKAQTRRAERPRVQPSVAPESATAAIPAPAPAELPPPPTSEAAIPILTPDEGGPADEAEVVKPPEAPKPNAESRDYRERSSEFARSKAPARRVWHSSGGVRPAVSASLPDAPEVTAGATVPEFAALPAALSRANAPSRRVVAFIKPSKSGLRQALHKVFGGRSEEFVPASPLDNPLPSSGKAPAGGGEDSVELAAKIDSRGNVVAVKVVQGNHHLAGVSAMAGR